MDWMFKIIIVGLIFIATFAITGGKPRDKCSRFCSDSSVAEYSNEMVNGYYYKKCGCTDESVAIWKDE